MSFKDKYGSGRGESLHIMPIRQVTIHTPHWLPPHGHEDNLNVYLTLTHEELEKLSLHLRREITERQTPDGLNRFIMLKEGKLELTFQEEGWCDQ